LGGLYQLGEALAHSGQTRRVFGITGEIGLEDPSGGGMKRRMHFHIEWE
jgi:hypothetical protein